ncbi:MAG: ATP-dependent helicase [Paenibacillus sp.]|nr:ATP-dependent helicase [Paenibacillus sp.]
MGENKERAEELVAVPPYTVALQVRQLVEYVFLSGSIDSRLQSMDSLQEGTKAHQRVQETYGEGDRKEVYLSTEIECEGMLFAVDGRCDGLLATEGMPTIDEIKSTRADLSLLEDKPVHWAQALFYAYMYARDEGLPAMGIQLTYVHKDTGETKRFRREASFGELEEQIEHILRQYAPYAKLKQRHEAERDASIASLAFPFDNYRAGQRKLAGAVYKTIEEGVSLYAKAPTGIGKTISTTYPAIKAMGNGMLKRLYYLTARTTTRAAAEDALKHMRKRGLHIHSVTITAKDKICFQDEVRCDKEHCPFADGYYDRINGAILDMLEHETIMSRATIEQYARKHTVCPFEMSLDAAYASDAVICDYNYVFDPRISFKRQYAEGKKATALLVDEAHNLVDRARDIFSAELTRWPFQTLQREQKGKHRGLYEASKAINEYFVALRKTIEDNKDKPVVSNMLPDELVKHAERFAQAAEQVLDGGFYVQASGSLDPGASSFGGNGAGGAGGDGDNTLLDAYFAVSQFLRMAKLYDERFATFAEVTRLDMRVKLFCMDPSELLKEQAKGYRSHVYFSATLTPVRYYMDMLGASDQDYTLALPSPFESERLQVDVRPISTRYQDRNESYGPIAKLIADTIAKRKGNYFVFFPSYAYMKDVYDAYTKQEGSESGSVVKLQRTDMSEEERDAFLADFRPDGERTLVGFAVLGGVFSEGVDLPGDRLIGVIVIGVGLPQLGLERNLLRDFFQREGKSGYDYAYVIPGMNKVLQAGGRPARRRTAGRSRWWTTGICNRPTAGCCPKSGWRALKVKNDFSEYYD